MGTRPSSSANEEVRLCTDDDQARKPDRLIVVWRHVRYGETQHNNTYISRANVDFSKRDSTNFGSRLIDLPTICIA